MFRKNRINRLKGFSYHHQKRSQWDLNSSYEIYVKEQKANNEYFENLFNDPIDQERKLQLQYHRKVNNLE